MSDPRDRGSVSFKVMRWVLIPLVLLAVLAFIPWLDCPGGTLLMPPIRSDKMRQRHRVMKCPDCEGRGRVALLRRWSRRTPSSFPHDHGYVDRFLAHASAEDRAEFLKYGSFVDDEGRDRALALVLSRLSAPELDAIGIRETGTFSTGWVIAYSDDSNETQRAIEGAFHRSGVTDFGGSTSLGEAGWSVPKDTFFHARRALLDDKECQRLGVVVPTPRFALPR